MKQTKLLLASLVIAIAFILGCQKELSQDPGGVFTPTDPTFTPNIVTSIKGRVVDEQDKPVQGALIKAGTTNTVTNVNGEFTLSNVNVSDQAAFVQATKQGYFTGSRTIVAKAANMHYVEMKLLPSQSVGSIDMATGGTVALTNGTSVTLPASSVVIASSNAAYNGSVNVSLAWIDPTSVDLEREMPGDLRGINEQGVERGMQSFGMVAVELRGAGGEKLQVATGKKASVKFFLPASIAGTAPGQIELWSFNESNGLWKQEGFATKAGNFYNAEVSHFSFWNCDAQFPVVNFTANVKDQAGKPLAYTSIRIKRTTTSSYTYGYTDSAGVVNGLVPSNEPLVLEVVNLCNTVIHTQNIGPFTASASISVTLNSSVNQVATVTGIANGCGGSPLANGIADLITGRRTYRTAIINGNFTFNIVICDPSQAATLVVIDTASGQQSTSSITISSGANNAGTLSACGTSIAEFMNYTIDGSTYQILPPADSLMAWYNVQNNRTMISGFSMNTGSYRSIEFTFNGNSLGTTNITSLRVTAPGGGGGSLPQAATIPATITEYGAPGGFVAGNFTGNIIDSSVTRTIQGSFRVRRN